MQILNSFKNLTIQELGTLLRKATRLRYFIQNLLTINEFDNLVDVMLRFVFEHLYCFDDVGVIKLSQNFKLLHVCHNLFFVV